MLLPEVSITPSFINSFTTSQAVRLLEGKKIDVQSLISHELALVDVVREFDLHLDKVSGTMKVVLKP